MSKSLRDPFFAVETCFGCKKALNKVANARVIWMHLFYVPLKSSTFNLLFGGSAWLRCIKACHRRTSCPQLIVVDKEENCLGS